MEKNEIALSLEEKKSLNSFSWNFLLLLLAFGGCVVLFFGGMLSFILWFFKKNSENIKEKVFAVKFRNYDVVTNISKEFKILKNKKTGKYGLCKNCSFIFSPRYEEIKMALNYELFFQPENNSKPFRVSFFTLKRDVA